MHAVGAAHPRDVGAIVDDDFRADVARGGDDAIRESREARARVVLAAKLQQPRTAAQAGLGQRDRIDRALAAEAGVDDGVRWSRRVQVRLRTRSTDLDGFREPATVDVFFSTSSAP